MGLAALVKRTIASVTPTTTRPNGGVFYGVLPTGAALAAAAPVLGIGGTAAWTYQGKPGVAAPVIVGTPAVEGWVEGVMMSLFSKKSVYYFCEIVSAVATPITAGRVWAEVAAVGTAVVSGAGQVGQYIPLAQPIYVPAGTVLCVAGCDSTGGNTMSVSLVVSYQK